MMKIKSKGMIIVVVALLMMAVLVPVYAQYQNGTPQQDRDQDCTPQGPATRAYGEDPPVQAQEEKPEGLSEEETLEEAETPIQEQTQTQEQLRECDYENADCEENQYHYQYQFKEQFRYGQEED
jgi:hypothetical protein